MKWNVDDSRLYRIFWLATLLPSLAGVAQPSPPVASDDAVIQNAPVPSQPSPSQSITLAQAIAMAERNSPQIRAAQAATAHANAAIQTARAYTNPTLEVYAGEQYSRPVPTPGVPGLLQHYAGYQAIESPHERSARRRIAEYGSAGSRFGQAAVDRSVVSAVKLSFYDVLRSQEEVKHSEENLALVEDLRRRVQVEVDVGEKGRLELTRAEAEIAQATFAVRRARIELANSIALLRVAIAAPADLNLDPQGTLEPRVQLPPLSSLRELVLQTHPALGQSKAVVQQAEVSLEHQRALRVPQPTVFAEFENQPDLRFWRAGVSIPLPLWDRRRGQIDESKAVIRQSSAELEQRRLELISATERAYEQYQLADQQAVSLESGELRAAERAVEGAQAAYKFGERGIVEVLDAQRVLQSVRGDLVEAQFARQTALTNLEELGAITPEGKP